MKRFLLAHIPMIDRLGIFVSSLCMVHCLALPVLLPLLSLSLHGEETSDLTHIVFAAILVPATIYAAYSGYRKHHAWMPVISFAIGTAAILSAVFFIHDLYGEFAEQALTVTGSILLIFAHIRNYRLQHVCDVECFSAKQLQQTSHSHSHSRSHNHLHHHSHTHGHAHTSHHAHIEKQGECCVVHSAEHVAKEHRIAINTVPLEV
jgi:hypothetical protein